MVVESGRVKERRASEPLCVSKMFNASAAPESEFTFSWESNTQHDRVPGRELELPVGSLRSLGKG